MASLRPRKKKSKKEQAGDLLVDYLRLKAAGKAAKGAKKAAKGTAVYQVSKRTPMVKRIPFVLGAAAAAVVAAKLVHGRGGDPATA
jgi:hypothetical protein